MVDEMVSVLIQIAAAYKPLASFLHHAAVLYSYLHPILMAAGYSRSLVHHPHHSL